MGQSLDDIINSLPRAGGVGVPIVTNQDTNRLVGYATGTLLYHPPEIVLTGGRICAPCPALNDRWRAAALLLR